MHFILALESEFTFKSKYAEIFTLKLLVCLKIMVMVTTVTAAAQHSKRKPFQFQSGNDCFFVTLNLCLALAGKCHAAAAGTRQKNRLFRFDIPIVFLHSGGSPRPYGNQMHSCCNN